MSPRKAENTEVHAGEFRNFLDFRGGSQLSLLTQRSQVFRLREYISPETVEEFRSGHRVFWAARDGVFIAVCAFRVQPERRYELDSLGQVALTPGAVEPFVRVRGESYVFVTAGRELAEGEGSV